MIRLSIPWGTLPSTEQFTKAYMMSYSLDHTIRMWNDPRFGNRKVTGKELWQEIKKAHRENTDQSLAWCMIKLRAMSIEWG